MLRRWLRAVIAGAGCASALLAWIAAGAWAAPHSDRRHCAGKPSSRCVPSHAQAARRGFAAPRRPKPFRGDESTIGQLPGHLRSTRALVLGGRCGTGWWRGCRSRPDLPEILLHPPSPETTGALNAYGIPAIADVPPIVLLPSPGGKDRDDPHPLAHPGDRR